MSAWVVPLRGPGELCKCGHRADRHEAGECWTVLATGEETWRDAGRCGCAWYEPVSDPAGGEWDRWHG